MLARVAKEREGHSARRRKCKCVLLLLVCEWLVAQSRPKGKEERTIWAEPQNGTAFRYIAYGHIGLRPAITVKLSKTQN